MSFIYSLEKGSKKNICPHCNKKTFVRYLNNESGEYIAPEFGRCDRENKCGYFSYPSEIKQNIVKYLCKPILRTSYHSPCLIESSGRNFTENNFISFLKIHFTESQIRKVILKYMIGTSNYWKGATIFWQIDHLEKIRHGKIMLYNKETGKRLKREKGGSYINSVRAVLKIENFNLKQCLFGLHLINEMNNCKIGIVESEKTAVIMSLFKPEYIWLATGSKNGFKYEYLKVLRNRNLTAFPDKSEYSDWLTKADELNKLGFNITVSEYLENTNLPSGTDLADAYFMTKQYNLKKRSFQKIPTIAEKMVCNWSKHKPEIWKLIDTFQLEDLKGKEVVRSS